MLCMFMYVCMHICIHIMHACITLSPDPHLILFLFAPHLPLPYFPPAVLQPMQVIEIYFCVRILSHIFFLLQHHPTYITKIIIYSINKYYDVYICIYYIILHKTQCGVTVCMYDMRVYFLRRIHM